MPTTTPAAVLLSASNLLSARIRRKEFIHEMAAAAYIAARVGEKFKPECIWDGGDHIPTSAETVINDILTIGVDDFNLHTSHGILCFVTSNGADIVLSDGTDGAMYALAEKAQEEWNAANLPVPV